MAINKAAGSPGATRNAGAQQTQNTQANNTPTEFPGGATAAMESGHLVINGASGDDTIGLRYNKEQDTYDVNINGQRQQFQGPLEGVTVRGGAGDDRITADGLEVPVRAFGGEGNDRFALRNSTDAYINGGAGNDWVGGVARRTQTAGVESGPRDPDSLNIRAASYNLMTQTGSTNNALDLVMAARGGNHTAPATPAERQAALDEIQQRLNLSHPPNATQLRDMDHYLNSFGAVRSVATPNGDEGAVRGLAEHAARDVAMPVFAAVPAAYAAAKWVAQTDAAQAVGFDPVSIASGGTYPGVGEGVSRPSLAEAWHGIQGAIDGAADTTPDSDD
jgi:hypothetical protein